MEQEINMLVFAPHSFDVVDVRPIGSASLVQTRTRQEGVEGFRNTIRLEAGLFASWASVHRLTSVEECYDSNGGIKINLRIAGESVISGKKHGPFEISSMMCSALLQPAGRLKFERFKADAHETSVTISATRTYLVDELGLSPKDFDGALRAFLEGKSYEFTLLKTEFTIKMKQIAETFFETDSKPFSLGLQMRARAHDILRLFFEGISADLASPVQFRPQELKMIDEVKRMLEMELSETLLLADTATAVGSSPSRLTRLFKAVEGRTISEHLAARRMARALELMQERRLSITQIAFEVGYEHSANFSTAFRRHYGMTPRQATRGIKQITRSE